MYLCVCVCVCVCVCLCVCDFNYGRQKDTISFLKSFLWDKSCLSSLTTITTIFSSWLYVAMVVVVLWLCRACGVVCVCVWRCVCVCVCVLLSLRTPKIHML